MAYFDVIELSNKTIKVHWELKQQIASDMNPPSTWVTPDVSESSAFCPVNAVGLLTRVYSLDANSIAQVYVASFEMSQVPTSTDVGAEKWDLTQLGYAAVHNWIILGSSRNIRIGGDDSDDNKLNAWVLGWSYSR